MLGKLKIFRVLSKPNLSSVQFQYSPRRLDPEDGETIIRALRARLETNLCGDGLERWPTELVDGPYGSLMFLGVQNRLVLELTADRPHCDGVTGLA